MATLPKISILIFVFTVFQSIALAEQNSEKDSINTDKANKTVTVPMPVSLAQQYKADLKHYLPKAKVKPMLVGTQEYITLINENTSPNNKGVAVLIPDWQQGAISPKAMSFLQKSLPTQGWTTISVQPNAKPDSFPSTALKLAEQIKENKSTLDKYKVNFTALFNAVNNKAKDYPGIVMIIAQGSHGAMLIELLDSDEELRKPNAIILLSSYVLTGERLLEQSNREFAVNLANSEPPVLDLYLKNDNAIVIDKAPQRLAKAKQEMKVYYRQRQLNNTSMGFYPEQVLLTQINSWLKSIGW